MANPAIQFHEVLQDAFGQQLPMPVPDGRPHYFHAYGDEPGILKGWYILRLDGSAASGCFGSWKVGGSWRSSLVDQQEAELVEEARADD